MHDEKTYSHERDFPLSLDGLYKILDSFAAFERKYPAEIYHFFLSGGDPLLREDWEKLIQEIVRRKKTFSMMGNPETLTEKTVKKLAFYKIRRFQMSLDGLENTHDYFRSPGSFARTLEKLDLLYRYNISSNIMFTLFPTNAQELIPLIQFLATQTKASSFSFDIGCFVGRGASLNQNFTPQKLHKIFNEFLQEKERLKKQGFPLQIFEKANLLKLSRFENDMLYPLIPLHGGVLSGCSIGYLPPAILSDGTLLPCRKLPIIIGKMPEQSFEEIYLGNTFLKKFRRPESFEGCGLCDFYGICRGCPANVYSMTGSPFAKNPLCFRKEIAKTSEETQKIQKGPSLKTSYREEWDYLCKRLNLFMQHEFLDHASFQRLYLLVCEDPLERNYFLKNPFLYVKNKNLTLHPDQLAYLMRRLTEETEYLKDDPVLEQIRYRLSEDKMLSFFD